MNSKKTKKFKVVEKDAVKSPVRDIKWEGEEISASATTGIDQDQGSGQAIVLRFFDFGVNPKTFKEHKPTAQELFNSHLKGIESLLWRDGLKPYDAVEPRLMFSNNNKFYRFIVAAIPRTGILLDQQTKTLSQLLTKTA